MILTFLFFRILLIILGVFTAYALYNYVVNPLVLRPLCLTDSNGCVRVSYYAYQNSALIYLRGSGSYVWYNSDKAFVYGQPVGRICQDPDNFEPAYAIDTKTGLQLGYQCVKSLPNVTKWYTDKGVAMKYLLYRPKGDFDVYSVLNLLDEQGIINL